MMKKTYRDKAQCPKGHKFVAIRRTSSEGKVVITYCPQCNARFEVIAGAVPA